MTYKILTDDTNKVIFRSRIRLATLDVNRQLDHHDDFDATGVDQSGDDEEEDLPIGPLQTTGRKSLTSSILGEPIQRPWQSSTPMT